MFTETKEDFMIADRQHEILDELKGMDLYELIEIVKKCPDALKEFRECSGFILGSIYDQGELDGLPEGTTATMKEDLIEILFNKIWNGAIKW